MTDPFAPQPGWPAGTDAQPPAPPAPPGPSAWGPPGAPAPVPGQHGPGAPGWGPQHPPATFPDPVREPASARSGYLIAGAGVLGIVGAVLPWLTLSGPSADAFETMLEAAGEGLGGLDKDGALTIVFAIVAVVAGLVRSRDKAPRATAITALVFGALTALVAVVDIADVNSTKDEFPMFASSELTIGVGIGLWLTLAAGAAIALTSLLALLRKT